MIQRNNFRGESDETAGAARAGKGLLTELLRCGRCGRTLHMRDWGKSGTGARYVCPGDFGAAGGRYCVAFGGATVDRRFEDEILNLLSPPGIRASVEALDRLSAQGIPLVKARRLGAEGLEMIAHHLMQHALCGQLRRVSGGGATHAPDDAKREPHVSRRDRRARPRDPAIGAVIGADSAWAAGPADRRMCNLSRIGSRGARAYFRFLRVLRALRGHVFVTLRGARLRRGTRRAVRA